MYHEISAKIKEGGRKEAHLGIPRKQGVRHVGKRLCGEITTGKPTTAKSWIQKRGADGQMGREAQAKIYMGPLITLISLLITFSKSKTRQDL